MLVCRLPFQHNYLTVDGTAGHSPVVFYPFSEGKKVTFNGFLKEIFAESIPQIPAEELPIFDSSEITGYAETKEEYLEKIHRSIDFIKKENLPKLVISRIKQVDFESKKLDGLHSFLKLSNRFPNAFCYYFISDGESWMGAFSELLGKYNKQTNLFETMSLAGTLPQNQAWTSKEIEEQKPVTEYILNILKNYSPDVEVSGTYDHISGNIKHLRTDFRMVLDETYLPELIAELHPTPAVCGVPVEKCRKAISHFEKHSRGLYSGYSRLEREDEVYFFVNLRCARLFAGRAMLFAGGGITAKSDPEKEWQETELKAAAVADSLVFI